MIFHIFFRSIISFPISATGRPNMRTSFLESATKLMAHNCYLILDRSRVSVLMVLGSAGYFG